MADSTNATLYLYTSLSSGSSHVVTATARLETILRSHRIPFQAIDLATDEQARRLWGRRANGRTLPGLVRTGSVLGDLEQIEEWNEYGSLKDALGDDSSFTSFTSATATTTTTKTTTQPASVMAPASIPTSEGERSTSVNRHISTTLAQAMREVGEEAARKAGPMKERSGSSVASKVSEVDQTLNDAAVLPPPAGAGDEASTTDTARLTDGTLPRPQIGPAARGSTTTAPVRGTNPWTTSAEEIKKIEEHLAIPEEDETERDMDKDRRDARTSAED